MRHVRLLLAFSLGLACVTLRAQDSGMTPLITSGWQLSSPFTDTEEGTDIGALIDSDPYTYWHSDWHSTPRADYHWVDVALNEPTVGIFCLYMHRRNSTNDHPTEVLVSGSDDGETWRELVTLSLPYQGFSGVTSAPFKITEAVSHIRITPVDCYSVFSSIWHAAELQIYQVSEAYEYSEDLSGIKINEIQVANIDQYIDNSYNYGGWIELYNTSSVMYTLENAKVRHTDIDGVVEEYSLEVSHGILKEYGYACLWFDHNGADGTFGEKAYMQIPFKMDPEGGLIELLNVYGEVVDAVMYPSAIARCAYARLTDGDELWGWTAYATPMESNNGSTFASKRLDPPVISRESTLFTTDIHFSVEIPEGTTLRYTTDGSTPTVRHGMTSEDGEFEAQSTTVFRFVLIADDKLPSQVVTRTFIKNENDLQIPMLCISTAPENLYDDMIGVYTKGTNGVSGNGQSSPCNWNMDWERPVNVEYLIKEDGEYRPALNQEAEFKIAGGWSRAYGGDDNWPMKSSFRLKAGKVYEGNNSFDYPIFADSKPYNKYKTLQVRNGGNDTYSRIYDAAIHEIFRRSGFYVDCQAWQPVHVFFNGEYLGMLNIRENNNKHYGESGYGIDTDEMDQFELNSEIGYEQKEGTKEAFMKWLDLTKQLAVDPTNESIWQEICAMVDVDEYCNYMAAECYLGGSDWLTNSNNLKGFRSRNDGGKFHLVLFDTDSAFGSTNMISSIYGLLSRYDGRYSDNDGVSYLAEIFFNMLQYEPFRQQFIHAFSIVDGSVMEPVRCKEIIDEMVAYTKPALALEGSDPTGSANNLYNLISSASRRSGRMNNMKTFMGLTEEYTVSIESNIPEGRLLVEGQEIPTRKFNGTLYGPVSISTKAPAGYVFRGWELVSDAKMQIDIIPFRSSWKYYDQGSLDGISWQAQDYNDDAWSRGDAPFGYGTVGTTDNAADYNTVLDYGSDASNKRPTYYFRQEFVLTESPAADDNFTLYYYLDDGAIFYVNGEEVGSYHCVSGSAYHDYSTAYESSVAAYGMVDVPGSLLREGNNVITVEVHNTSATSTDIFFDARLTKSVSESTFIGNQEKLVLNEEQMSGNCRLMAVYDRPDNPVQVLESGASPVRINEVSSGNSIYINDYYKKNDWVELYNTTGTDIDVNGMYLSDDRSNPQKYQISAEGSMASTIIPAYGRLIVWCDKLTPISQLHAPFKLDNADGAYVILQAEDGTWSDEMEYLEQDRWQTYGRYPDGGQHASYQSRPSIAMPNVMGVYDFTSENAAYWGDSLLAITLGLEKGWNWISHNLASPVHTSRFTSYAQHIVGQHESLIKEDDNGWSGTLDGMNTAMGYKVRMASAIDITLRGTLFDVNTPVSVMQGWNWVGFPLYNATTIEAALKDYSPAEGDAIVGINAFAVYEDGKWVGSLTSLSPGQAYLFKCENPQTFCWNSLTAPVLHRARRYNAPEEDRAVSSWSTDMHAYPNVTCVVATLEANDGVAENCAVAAFCNNECRGVAQMVDGLLYMNIYGEGGENLCFKFMDEAGVIYNAEQTLVHSPETVVGSRKAPFRLTMLGSDVQSPSLLGMRIVSTTCYTLNGMRISHPASGIFIEKTVYENGNVVIKKIIR